MSEPVIKAKAMALLVPFAPADGLQKAAEAVVDRLTKGDM